MNNETKNYVLRSVTKEYLSKYKLEMDANPGITPDSDKIEKELLEAIHCRYREYNADKKDNKEKWLLPAVLPVSVVVDIIAALYSVCRIPCAGEDADPKFDVIALYQTCGRNKGIYVESESELMNIAIKYNYQLDMPKLKEVIEKLHFHGDIPRKTRCENPDLIAVNNGIFNYKTKQLLPFTPEFIFMSKSRVNYNPDARNISIHNDTDNTEWNVEDWMKSLSDDPEIVNVLWEILGAIIRPHVRWNKAAWLYSETGNNGKGTLCELMRNLCGANTYASIPIADFGKNFQLEPLINASAVIVDENDVGIAIDRAENLKAAVTGNILYIDRKYRNPISFRFHGFMVQCLNGFPDIKDKSNSFYRRQLFIPMSKCFTGQERRYIKNDYLHRPEVLEYVLLKVLNMDYYELSEPSACKNLLNEYKQFNDPVRQFFYEMSDQFTWDLLPLRFLYDLYSAWFRENCPSGNLQKSQAFNKEIRTVADESKTWRYAEQVRTSSRLDRPEPLIRRYNLTNWEKPNKEKYSGLQRC